MSRTFAATALACAYFLFLTGCIQTSAPPPTAGGDHGHDHDHGAHEEGPHKGHVIELGNGEYHAELTHTEADHDVTVYLLDESLKKPVTTTATELTLNVVADGKPESFKLAAAPAEGDAAGWASKFSLKDEKLCELLHGDVKGQVNVSINDKQFTGDLAHAHHDDGHGHKH